MNCATCGVVGARVGFDLGSSELRPDARLTLRRQAAWLLKYSTYNVVIAGSGDDRGTEDYDLALGYRRASADRDFLVQHGVAGSRITVVSYGRDHPATLGAGQKPWARTRTAVTFIRKTSRAGAPAE